MRAPASAPEPTLIVVAGDEVTVEEVDATDEEPVRDHVGAR